MKKSNWVSEAWKELTTLGKVGLVDTGLIMVALFSKGMTFINGLQCTVIVIVLVVGFVAFAYFTHRKKN